MMVIVNGDPAQHASCDKLFLEIPHTLRFTRSSDMSHVREIGFKAAALNLRMVQDT